MLGFYVATNKTQPRGDTRKLKTIGTQHPALSASSRTKTLPLLFLKLNVKDLLYLFDLLAADGTSLRGGTQWFVKKLILTVVLGMAHCRG